MSNNCRKYSLFLKLSRLLCRSLLWGRYRFARRRAKSGRRATITESWWVEGKKKGGGERARKATNRRKFRALERLTTVESTDVGSSFLVALTSVACHWNHETSPHLYDRPSDYVATLSPLLSHCRCAHGSAGRICDSQRSKTRKKQKGEERGR